MWRFPMRWPHCSLASRGLSGWQPVLEAFVKQTVRIVRQIRCTQRELLAGSEKAVAVFAHPVPTSSMDAPFRTLCHNQQKRS